MASGCLFTDGKYVLAGLQTTDESSPDCISGFGGKSLEGESNIHTAIRETLEELFGVEEISIEIINSLFRECLPRRFLENGDYQFLVYSFEDYYDWVLILSKYDFKSPLYDILPLTINDLIFKRKPCENCEVKRFALLPLSKDLKIDKNFQKDINILIEKIETNGVRMYS